MNLFFILTVVLLALSGMCSAVRQYQMLQQNSYYLSRYFKWVFPFYRLKLLGSLFLATVFSVLIFFKLYIISFILAVIIFALRLNTAFKTQKKSVKALALTPRVKRLFVTAVLLLAALCVLSVFINYTYIAAVVFSLVSPLLCVICRILNSPIEHIINAYYIADAKKIIKSHKNLKVIGITGSYGKTTTKFILTRILSEKFNVVCTPHSFNTPMGITRTIRSDLKPQTEVFVCEMGAKEVGNIKEDCVIANPHHGIITSVGPQHLETFKSIENVYKTKFELADFVAKNGGMLFANGDSTEISRQLDRDCKIYGTDKKFEYFADNISYGRFGSTFTMHIKDTVFDLNTKLLGLHSIIDIIGAVSLSYELGVPVSDIQYAVASLKPAEHRLEMKPFQKGSLLIDDAYNSNPEGCLEAVRVLGSFDGMKKVVVTPGLIELGEKEYECNFNLGLEAAKCADIIILVGLNRSKPMADAVKTTDFNKDNLYIAASFKEAMEIYNKFADSNTVVLFENDLPDNYLN